MSHKKPYDRPFLRSVQHFASEHKLYSKGSSILLAVSGGPDSVALLHFFVSLKEKYDLRLGIAHVNYRLRGKDSDLDEQLVSELAKRFDIPLFIKRYSNLTRESSEAKLRDLRFSFFNKTAKEKQFSLIATAHTEDDQAETLLLRLFRGSGLQGLQAIRPKNGNIIHPFLNTSRKSIESYLSLHLLPFRIDQSNLSSRYTRNIVRNELFPILEKLFDRDIRRSIAKAADLLQEDALLLSELLPKFPFTHEKNKVSFSKKYFLSQKLSLKRTLLRSAIALASDGILRPESEHVRQCLLALESTKNKTPVVTFQGLKFIRKGDTVTLLYKKP